MRQYRINKFLPHSITIYRLGGVKDEYGGKTTSWDEKYKEIPCRIYGMKGNYVITLEGREYDTTHKLISETGVDLMAGDKIKNSCNQTFMVLSVAKLFKARSAHHIEAVLSRIDE